MIRTFRLAIAVSCVAVACRESPEPTAPAPPLAAAQSASNPNNPAWWNKYQYLAANGPLDGNAAATATTLGSNVDVSNECGPQSETFITLNPNGPRQLTAGSNEIFRLPMRAYFSSDGGGSWGGVDVPLPPPLSGTNDTRFGSDPSLAFDTHGNAFYSFITVFFSANFGGINGTELAVARSGDGGHSWPLLTEFSFQGGSNHFNDKPMITVDQGAASPFRDHVYVAWDAAFGGSSAGGIRVAHSADHGASFVTNRADNPSGPGRSIGAVPFVGPDGTLAVAWNDFAANVIAVNRSFDGGVTWNTPGTIAPKVIPFDIGIPAESFRRALVYPACDADRSTGPHRGRTVSHRAAAQASGSRRCSPQAQKPCLEIGDRAGWRDGDEIGGGRRETEHARPPFYAALKRRIAAISSGMRRCTICPARGRSCGRRDSIRFTSSHSASGKPADTLRMSTGGSASWRSSVLSSEPAG